MCADTPEKTDYKSTLNLPKTGFPMRAGLPKRQIYARVLAIREEG